MAAVEPQIQPQLQTSQFAESEIRAAALPTDIAPTEPRIELAACDSDAVVTLCDQLQLNPLVAQTLVRRGWTDVAAAREFLAADQLHDPQALPGVVPAAEAIARQVRNGGRIAVHGDYDVDGVCSTAILVRTLARIDAQVTWHVPSRFEDGYGLSRAAIDRLASDGVTLIVAVDCGITAVDETAHALAQGIEIVICDHHTPGDALPDAPIVHPALGDYPCPELCAAATTFKLAQVLVSQLGHDPAMLDDELELVAMATVCDVVPLRGENRALVKRGISAMRATMRPGLRELMRVAAVDQLTIDATTFGFRMGPRINAAGRMFSAEPAVELMLTTSSERAATLATELNAANARRQEIEQSILREAEMQAREQRDKFAIVVAGAQWHPGVLGIVAGRIAEQFRRPCVALAIDGDVAAGSGRGGGVYDLLGGLTACSEHLTRFGGHKAAAGLELEQHLLPTFTRDFQAHAESELTADDLRPRARVDAIADPSQLTLDSADALAELGPFGMGNPEPALLIPAVTVTQLKKMGDRGQHLRLSIQGHGGRAGVVAFGWERAVAFGEDAPVSNIVLKLKRNEFRGTVEAQGRMVAQTELAAAPADEADTSWVRSFNAAFAAPLPGGGGGSIDLAKCIDRRPQTPLATIAGLAAELHDTLIVFVNDPDLWRDRFRALAAIDQRFSDVLPVAYGTPLEFPPGHALLAEPPLSPSLAPADCEKVTIGWNAPIARATAARAADMILDRSHVVAVFRALKESGESALGKLVPVLRAASPSPRIAAHAVRALAEIDVVGVVRSAEAVESITIADSQRTELDRSATFRSYSELKEESQRWLAQLTADSQTG
ncbi:MAG: single-stranded-DNA-specific exonuclease RecJ [Solirubrobacterales bacterium]